MDATLLTYTQCRSAIVDMYKSGLKAVYLDSQPGTGKTAMGQYVRDDMGLKNLYIIKTGHHEPVDFHGVPVPDHSNKRTYFYSSGDLLPDPGLEGGCLFLLDEQSDAMTMMQNLVCQMVFEGGLHNYVFPKDTYFLLTGNRVSDRSGAQKVVTKLGNRVAWFTLQPTTEELYMYGIQNGWNPAVLAFLKLRGGDPVNPTDRAKDGRIIPTFFNSFDPSDPAQMIKPVFASSRSWEFASNLFNYIDKVNPHMGNGDVLARVASVLGTPVAVAVVPFRSESVHMPNPDEILAGKPVKFPTKQSVLWTLTISLVSRVVKSNWKHMDAWLKQGPAEFRVLAVRLAFDTKAAKLIGPDFNASLQESDIKQALTAK